MRAPDELALPSIMNATPTVRPARPEDADAWLAMRRELWPEETAEGEHREEVERFFRGDHDREPWEVLLAFDADGRALGFVELSVRTYAEGCTTSNVAYLEGWFVVAEARQSGVGRTLVRAAEDWGRARGCTEFASDADPANETSCTAHEALGFEDAGLVRCFRKELGP